ncbi:hypothetical protein N7492_001939 [Penicillium capsulatum]|uniref:Zn(2)-C6 fungal-type domain-containing protein n=1 Tax=Penicillium capsulatum TaxID=69766 RepID=A0A9W9IJ63_9EURO|nr:hypothetical protein N7492_001939 [Penicillium capsulatum]KAJ6123438.1 hypothetical protein N7512_005903 [Penicillium capsulatum]
MIESPSQRRKRKPINCEPCRRSKIRCDRQRPCNVCKRHRRESACSYATQSGLSPGTPVRKVINTSNRTGGSPRQTIACTPVQAPEVPIAETSQGPPDTLWETVLERPAPEYDIHDTLSPLSMGPRMSLQELLDALPPHACCDYLISHFFKYISALFPILHGPTFQKRYTAFKQRPRDVDLP